MWLGVTCPVPRAPLCSVPGRLSVRAAALLTFPCPPAPLLTELFYPPQVVNDAWSPGRWSRRLVGGDVPMPSLTCPPPWEDASQSPNQVTALRLRALSQCPWGGSRSAVAGGMLILSSRREDYRLINPPKFLGTLSPRQGPCGGCGGAGTGAELSPHPAIPAQRLPYPPQCPGRAAPAAPAGSCGSGSFLAATALPLTDQTLCCHCWKGTIREGARPPTARFLSAFSVPPPRAGPGAALLSGFS